MSERFMVVPVVHADGSAFGDETDRDSVFDAGAGEGERAERRGSVPILQYSREPNKYEQKKLSPDLFSCDRQLKEKRASALTFEMGGSARTTEHLSSPAYSRFVLERKPLPASTC
ncbi:hypothetical protein Q8A67_024874 [Cirrhinus molitorella]|uniref:Uncharacterized protein n=1 Tax=Cirrhinus molitorella TaxID=172907 RepID=A0AA88TAX0_9TELE|nr:hypothetical protein Q8A67_024874 [Cirrhinus molitorella]